MRTMFILASGRPISAASRLFHRRPQNTLSYLYFGSRSLTTPFSPLSFALPHERLRASHLPATSGGSAAVFPLSLSSSSSLPAHCLGPRLFLLAARTTFARPGSHDVHQGARCGQTRRCSQTCSPLLAGLIRGPLTVGRRQRGAHEPQDELRRRFARPARRMRWRNDLSVASSRLPRIKPTSRPIDCMRWS